MWPSLAAPSLSGRSRRRPTCTMQRPGTSCALSPHMMQRRTTGSVCRTGAASTNYRRARLVALQQPKCSRHGTGTGTTVATDGSTIVIGAEREEEFDSTANRGAVYVFDAATGQLRHKLTASDAVKNGFFGAPLQHLDLPERCSTLCPSYTATCTVQVVAWPFPTEPSSWATIVPMQHRCTSSMRLLARARNSSSPRPSIRSSSVRSARPARGQARPPDLADMQQLNPWHVHRCAGKSVAVSGTKVVVGAGLCLGSPLSGYSSTAIVATAECLGRYHGADLTAGVYGSADCVSLDTTIPSQVFYTPSSGHTDIDALCRTCDGLCTHLHDSGADSTDWRGCTGPPATGGESNANVRLYTGCEAAYVFDALSGAQLLKLTPSDSSTDDRFGAPSPSQHAPCPDASTQVDRSACAQCDAQVLRWQSTATRSSWELRWMTTMEMAPDRRTSSTRRAVHRFARSPRRMRRLEIGLVRGARSSWRPLAGHPRFKSLRLKLRVLLSSVCP